MNRAASVQQPPVRRGLEFRFALFDPAAELIDHAVVCEGQDEQLLVDYPGDDKVAGRTDAADLGRNATLAVSQMVVDSAIQRAGAPAPRIIEEVLDGLGDERSIPLACCRSERVSAFG